MSHNIGGTKAGINQNDRHVQIGGRGDLGGLGSPNISAKSIQFKS